MRSQTDIESQKIMCETCVVCVRFLVEDLICVGLFLLLSNTINIRCWGKCAASAWSDVKLLRSVVLGGQSSVAVRHLLDLPPYSIYIINCN